MITSKELKDIRSNHTRSFFNVYDALQTTADLIEAIDNLLVLHSNGPEEMAPLLNELYLLLHPEVSK